MKQFDTRIFYLEMASRFKFSHGSDQTYRYNIDTTLRL